MPEPNSLLAAKLLGAVARKDPSRTLAFVQEFSEEIADWADCDTLGTQSVRAIAVKQQGYILEMSRRLIATQSTWERRFGVVLLTCYADDAVLRDLIIIIVRPLRADKEHYMQKALAWLAGLTSRPAAERVLRRLVPVKVERNERQRCLIKNAGSRGLGHARTRETAESLRRDHSDSVALLSMFDDVRDKTSGGQGVG